MKDKTMKTLLKHTPKKSPISILKQIMVITTSIDIGFNFDLLLKMPSGDFYYKDAESPAVIISALGLSVIMPLCF